MEHIIEPKITWPVFDKVYSNLTEARAAIAGENDDGVAIGRFVLIKYCDIEFTLKEKLYLETGSTANGGKIPQKPPHLTEEEFQQICDNYKNNYEADGRHTKDRLILQKTTEKIGSKYQPRYEELCYLNQADIWNVHNRLERVEEFFDPAESDDDDPPQIDRLVEILQWFEQHHGRYQELYNDVQTLGRFTFVEKSTDSREDTDILTTEVQKRFEGKIPRGHIGIIEREDSSGNFSIYNIYIFDLQEGQTTGTWKALQHNYKATDVYFPSDIRITQPIGYIELVDGGGYADVEIAGQNLVEAFETIFKRTIDPIVTLPTLTINWKAGTKTTEGYEVGTTITPEYVVTWSPGLYQYGPATEVIPGQCTVADNAKSITGNIDLTTNTLTGSLGDIVVKDNMSYVITASLTHNAANTIPKNNIDLPAANTWNDLPANLKIEETSLMDDTVPITSWRRMYAGSIGSNIDLEDNTALARAIMAIPNNTYGISKKASKTATEFTAQVGTERLIIAFPRNISAVEPQCWCETMGGWVPFHQFDRLTSYLPIGYEALNNSYTYEVYVFEPDEAFASNTKFKFQLQ